MAWSDAARRAALEARRRKIRKWGSKQKEDQKILSGILYDLRSGTRFPKGILQAHAYAQRFGISKSAFSKSGLAKAVKKFKAFK